MQDVENVNSKIFDFNHYLVIDDKNTILDNDLKIFNYALYENENSYELDNSFNCNLLIFNNNTLLNNR